MGCCFSTRKSVDLQPMPPSVPKSKAPYKGNAQIPGSTPDIGITNSGLETD